MDDIEAEKNWNVQAGLLYGEVFGDLGTNPVFRDTVTAKLALIYDRGALRAAAATG